MAQSASVTGLRKLLQGEVERVALYGALLLKPSPPHAPRQEATRPVG